MKIYIISNDSGNALCSEFVDVMEKNSGISTAVKERDGGNMEYIIKSTLDALSSSGDSAPIFVFADNPVGATIALNKQKDISAALCNSYSDYQDAKGENANVIIIGKEFRNISEIAKEFQGQKKEAPKVQRNAEQKAQEQKKPVQAEQKKKEEDNDGHVYDDGKKAGIAKRIKDALGII